MLESKGLLIETIVDAGKTKIGDIEAWEILQKGKTITIASGKKCIEFLPKLSNKSMILDQAIGRSGTLRAPTLILANKIVVGFQNELYNTLFD